MTTQPILFSLFLTCCCAAGFPSGNDEIPAQHAARIFDAAPQRPRVEPRKLRRVLVWNTPFMEQSAHRGYCIPYGTCAMKTLGEKTGAFEPVVSDDLALLLPENITRFDAIVMNNSDGPWIRPRDDEFERFKPYGESVDEVESVLRRSLLDYVRNGGGIVAYHFAIGANRQWPGFHELLGAAYAGHPWHEEVGVRVEEPGHPLVAAFEGKNFRITEEIFQFKEPYSRGTLRVLLSLDTETTNMSVQWIERTDNDFALAWVKSYGEGRVFYTTFGHRAEIYSNPAMLQFYLDAIQFATGDLEASTEPREGKPENGSQ